MSTTAPAPEPAAERAPEFDSDDVADVARVMVEAVHDPDLASIRGRVVDRFERPIDGVEVQASVRVFPFARRSAATETAADGWFEIRDTIPGRASLRFVHPEYCSVDLRSVELAAGRRTEIPVVRMFGGSEVKGVVRVDGKPAGGLQLWILGESGPRARAESAAAISDRAGEFTLRERLPPGKYRVLVMPAMQFGPFARISSGKVVVAEFDLVPGQAAHFVSVDLESKQ
jgi:hypothetical protein